MKDKRTVAVLGATGYIGGSPGRDPARAGLESARRGPQSGEAHQVITVPNQVIGYTLTLVNEDGISMLTRFLAILTLPR